MKTSPLFLALFLLSSFVWAHDGQEGSGTILDISPAERIACLTLELTPGKRDPYVYVSYMGENLIFVREELEPKCRALNPKLLRPTR